LAEDIASALFGVEGLRVVEAESEADGTLTVWAVTAHPGAAACPDCRTRAGRVHEHVLARPRDQRRGLDKVSLCWLKRRWKCGNDGCGRKTFTESLPEVPAGCRLTGRLRQLLGAEVAERGCTVTEAGRWQHVSWPVTHAAFAGRADPVLARAAGPVAHLGIDEHRRGRPRWRIDEDSGEYVLLADRWHTCFSGLSGDQGLLGQVEGRTADDAAYWLGQASPAWRDHIQIVATGMCSIYASAVRRMLPRAQIVADLFHVVQLAVKMTGDVRRRAVREKYGRRGRSGDAEYGIKGLLVRNLEHLRPEQFAKVMDTLSRDRHGQEIAAAWIGKEKLRDALNLRAAVTRSTPCERDVRGRLASFYDWCAQNDDIPELVTLARTVSRWENEITCAVLTGVTNARSESLNRIAKLEARRAYSFRNPANQRRRVRMACTRGNRREQGAALTRSRLVTGRKHDPG
jgi:transposase